MSDLTLSQTVRKIVEKALSPDEWTAFPDAASSGADAKPEAEKLLAQWKKLISLKTNDAAAFDKRLQHLGLERESAIYYLASHCLPENASLPSWAKLLSEVLIPSNFAQPVVTVEQLQDWTNEEIDAYKLTLKQTPIFPEFLHPFISVVLRQINALMPNVIEIFSDNAWKQIARYLLLRLSKIAARVVAFEVKQRRFRGQLIGVTSQERYQYFVRNILGTPECLSGLFLQYPVLARLLAVCSEQAVEVAVELLQRLQQDLNELKATFQPNSHLGLATSLLMGMSDLHQGSRSVCIIEFESGLKLVYKPRSFEIDSAFNSLIDWLNQTGETPKLRPTRILPRAGYGWSEFISTADCTAKEQVAKFYQRQGVYAAIAYFLCGTDFHWENFIAAGEFPVPIDLEALLATSIHEVPEEFKQLPKYLYPLGMCSVLSSCMSFFWRAGNYDQILFSGTGINGCGDRPWHTGITVWQGIGTDELKLTRQYLNFYFNKNLPRSQGDKIPVNDYIDEVIQGFSAAYRTLMQHREELLAPQGILAAFRTVTTRSVLRDTNDYANTLFWSLKPEHLTSGAAYDVALELLCREILVGNSIPFTKLLDEEKRCCWQQNIPSYYSSPLSHSIYSSSGVSYELAINQVSFEQMQQLLGEASEEDLIWQSELLRVSLEMSVYPRGKQVQEKQVGSQTVDNSQLSLLSLKSSALSEQWLLVSGWSNFSEKNTQDGQVTTSDARSAMDTDGEYNKPTAKAQKLQRKEGFEQVIWHENQSVKERLLQGAIAIGDALEKLAMSHAWGNSWLCFSRISQNSTVVAPIHPLPWNSMGAAGTSIFLANLACQTKDERYQKLARGALKFTASALQHFIDKGLWDEVPISGYNGLCLFIYALTECGRCLDDEILGDRALDWVLKLTPERLRQEQNPDVLNGAAGALLALLHLYKLRPDSRLIERATSLGESILNCQEKAGIDRGWRMPNFERSLLGMGHGAAGIACALLRLYALTGNEQFRISAESGLAYERSHFCHETKDWPNLQKSPGKLQFMTGWCAGAPGIGLARLGILGILGDESEIRDEIEFAIAAAQRHLGKYQHHLCCGEAGRIAFLCAAAQRLERPELFPVAISAGLKMIDFYEQVGHWRLQEFSERNIIPGLLDGVSGIGLTLLGLISPESTSQIMLLD
ncbi:type 2 lanthipeptide synthetase LanM family protein [Microcoleus sp. B5-D4]|uniref:type 2 lanthipeptide synthetase LanM family protein n=1 Tax=unclassified Microcoleus TaxID=2642155 RepID=UPI002FD141B4